MKYAVLIYGAPDQFDGMSDEERRAVYDEYVDLIGEPEVRGSVRLEPVASAVTVRVREGEVVATDGPFPETKEYFGGFYLVEVATREEAVEFAARLPAARMGGAVEVRPLAHG
jgi:hypothetical protein